MSRVGIIVEGGLLAADLVERIALGDETVAGQKPKDFGLEAGRLSAEIQAAFSAARVYWEGFKLRRETPGVSPVTVTREAWIYPLFERLGCTLTFQRAAAQVGGQAYAISHRVGEAETGTPVHTVAFNQKLDERGELKRSPHALLQEYLNKSDALWGIVTNGRELRLLRNSARSSRPSYVAIDLETILDGNLYNEFALVFRLLHRSRFPVEGDPHDCLLETWYQQGIEEGGRVRRDLRNGVKAALETLGSGFLGHPANAALRAKLDTGSLTDLQLYRELLNLIYRLLFLMVAEERRLLFVPEAGEAARHEVYLRWYGIGRLRDRAERRTTEDGYGDLWEGLKETFRLFRDEAAAKHLALTALNGELFRHDACFDLEDRNTALRNSDLLDAIRQLSTFEERAGRKKTGVQRRVNYAGLDVEELGSIYESLLDYHPQVLRDPWRFALAAGSQRKETGSYYTPPELVRELIESALVPVMEARLNAATTKEEKERALLSLTICDPAAGSGHFLLAAARRVGRELAIIRSGEAEPAPETYRAALRDVIRHCLYAVDKNPLAVDLCKVALWIEGHSPGLPLSFLDHRIRCGDSLIGVFDLEVLKAGVPDDAFKRLTGDDPGVCAELRRINRRDRGGELAKFSAEAILAELAAEFAALAEMPDETPGDVHSKEELYRQLKESERVARLHNACDAWTAAFFASRGSGQERTTPTTADVWSALNGQPNHQRAAIIDELSERFRFFHWRLEFPEVFARGGFDVLLGNPPWEKLTIIDQQYFAAVPQIADEQNAKKRKEEISKFLAAHRDLERRYVEAQLESERYSNFVREANRFPYSARGELNLYPLFAELFDQLSSPSNRAGFIAKSMLFTGSTWAEMTEKLIQSGRLQRVIDFKNWKLLFPQIGYHERYSLVNLSKPDPVAPLKLAIGLVEPSQITNTEKIVFLRRELLARINPETGTLPSCESERDLKILERVARELPTLSQEASGWNMSYTTGLHMTGDVAELRDLESLTDDGYRLEGNHLVRGSNRFLPVYEGKLIHQYDHRFGTFEGVPRSKRFGRKAAPIRFSPAAFENPEAEILPRYWVSEEFGRANNAHRGLERDWAFCFRDTTNVISNFRTAVGAVVGNAAFNYKCPNIVYHGSAQAARELAIFLTMFNSVPFDFLVRSKFYGANFTKSLLDQCFVVPRSDLHQWENELIQHAVSLSCLSSSVMPFSTACG